MLQVSGIDAWYGNVQVLRGLSLSVAAGEVLCMLGRNGAGKTTALKAIMGLVRPRSGSIRLDGVELTRLPAHEIPGQGIAYVPQGRRLFAELSVAENLEIGLMARRAASSRCWRLRARCAWSPRCCSLTSRRRG
jgi:branched-chain amino acid transport system ATP-binding protein